MEESEILRLVRTPEGKGVCVIRANGGGETWRIASHGSRLVRAGSWLTADFVVPLERGELFKREFTFPTNYSSGHNFATYTKSDGILTFHSPSTQTVSLPQLESLFTMPSPDGYESIIGITVDFTIVHLRATKETGLILQSKNRLPLTCPPKLILPVDPMAWGLDRAWNEHDVLLSVSGDGELAFWVPETISESGWRCTGKVRTGRTGIKKARCSSAKKTALGGWHTLSSLLYLP